MLMSDHEELARRCAHIIGPFSAAALALQELDRRRKAGEEVRIYQTGRSWVVVPPITEDERLDRMRGSDAE